jgi:hypothetical protein
LSERVSSLKAFIGRILFRNCISAFLIDHINRIALHNIMKLLASALTLGLLLAVLGCGSEPHGKVSGKVTFNDKPMTGGTVVFATADGKRTEYAQIQPDGTYSSPNVPVGEIHVAVWPAPKNVMANMPPEAKGKIPLDNPEAAKIYGKKTDDYVDIPQPLRDPTKSNLSVKVNSGEQTYDIPLKSGK